MARKTWAADDVLTAEDLNEYLMDQSVMVFASTGDRSGAILAPIQGMLTYRTDAGIYEYWTGSAWAEIEAGSAFNAERISGQTVFIQSATPTANATNDLWFW
jgi:hypothetical protein